MFVVLSSPAVLNFCGGCVVPCLLSLALGWVHFWPAWGCGVSGFLNPAVFMVFRMGSPDSGRDCVLPQSAIVPKTFPPSGGFGSWPSCGVPCLRLALLSSACVGPGGWPFFSQVRPAPSPWIPLLWAWLVWNAATVFLLCIPSECGHPLGQ